MGDAPAAIARWTSCGDPMELDRLYSLLDQNMDVEDWWPSDGPFEVMVGALLTQQTTWEKVVPVLDALEEKGLMTPLPLSLCPLDELQAVIQPTGFYRQKARRLIRISQHIVNRHEGKPGKLLLGDLTDRRQELLSLPGVGPETADSMLLFGGARPKFVAASYVLRVFHRTGVLPDGDYRSAQALVETRYPDDAHRYRQLYAMLVQLAKQYCRSRPRCNRCPLGQDCSFTHQ